MVISVHEAVIVDTLRGIKTVSVVPPHAGNSQFLRAGHNLVDVLQTALGIVLIGVVAHSELAKYRGYAMVNERALYKGKEIIYALIGFVVGMIAYDQMVGYRVPRKHKAVNVFLRNNRRVQRNHQETLAVVSAACSDGIDKGLVELIYVIVVVRGSGRPLLFGSCPD